MCNWSSGTSAGTSAGKAGDALAPQSKAWAKMAAERGGDEESGMVFIVVLIVSLQSAASSSLSSSSPRAFFTLVLDNKYVYLYVALRGAFLAGSRD